MADADELKEIRERKLERLRARARDEESTTEQEPTDREGSPDADESPDEPVHVRGSGHLRELIASHDPVLVDFHADWCGPCRMLEPVVAELAAETPATVAKVDADAHGALTAEYGVQGLPTLVLFSGGEPVERVVGATDGETLAGLVQRYA